MLFYPEMLPNEALREFNTYTTQFISNDGAKYTPCPEQEKKLFSELNEHVVFYFRFSEHEHAKYCLWHRVFHYTLNFCQLPDSYKMRLFKWLTHYSNHCMHSQHLAKLKEAKKAIKDTPYFTREFNKICQRFDHILYTYKLYNIAERIIRKGIREETPVEEIYQTLQMQFRDNLAKTLLEDIIHGTTKYLWKHFFANDIERLSEKFTDPQKAFKNIYHCRNHPKQIKAYIRKRLGPDEIKKILKLVKFRLKYTT